MNIEIRRWDYNEIIVCGEYDNIKDCIERNKEKFFYRADLRYANLSDADLRYANLSDADLRYTNLSDADLRYANLSDADLRYANLSDADLRYANLSDADLRYANLSDADLRYANLSDADLRGANLSYADLSKRYIQVACIGSRKGMTTYCFDDDKIWCGCWSGNLAEFEARVKDVHSKNKQYLDEYLGFIQYAKKLNTAS